MSAGVVVHYRGHLAQLTGCAQETFPAASVRDVLRAIRARHGTAAYKEAKAMLVAVDGESITLHKGFATRLIPGQTVRFLPICAGG